MVGRRHHAITPSRNSTTLQNPPPLNISTTESDLLTLGESTRQKIKYTEETHSEDVDAHLALTAQFSKTHAEDMAKLTAEHELMLEAQTNGKFKG